MSNLNKYVDTLIEKFGKSGLKGVLNSAEKGINRLDKAAQHMAEELSIDGIVIPKSFIIALLMHRIMYQD